MCLWECYITYPVGWGFLAAHAVHHRAFVITDGGTIGRCFEHAFRLLRKSRLVRYALSEPLPWLWIVSHLDYDHFSLILSLIKRGICSMPRCVLVPSSYKKCRELLLLYLSTFNVLSALQRIPSPKFEELFDVLADSRVIGVEKGTVIRAGLTEYRFLWPPASPDRCEKLEREIRSKLERICRRRGVNLEEMLDKWEKIVDRIDIIDATDERLSVEELIEHRPERKILEEPVTSVEEGSSLEHALMDLTASAEAEYRQDLEDLYRTHLSAMNSFSLAYVLGGWRGEVVLHPTLDLHIMDGFRIYGTDKNQVLYLSDLQGRELEEVAGSLSQDYQVLLEISPHHGNAFANSLSKIKPVIAYSSRCLAHPPRSWLRGRDLRYLNIRSTIVTSDHDLGLLMLLMPR